MNKYDLVIFDLDGTVLNTTEGVLAAVKHTIKHFGFDMPSDEKLETFIGPPIQDSFAKMYGLSGDILQDIATVFRNQYKDYDLLKAKPYDGIYELLEEINKRTMVSAIATYKREDYALTLLKHYRFDKYMNIMHGGDHENKLKKHDIIKICIDEAGIDNFDRVVMIGDTVHDAVGAENMGVDFIGVTYGFGFNSQQEIDGVKSVGFCDKPLDILNIIGEN